MIAYIGLLQLNDLHATLGELLVQLSLFALQLGFGSLVRLYRDQVFRHPIPENSFKT